MEQYDYEDLKTVDRIVTGQNNQDQSSGSRRDLPSVPFIFTTTEGLQEAGDNPALPHVR